MDIQSEILKAFQVEHKEQVDGIRSILASLRDRQAPAGDERWNEAFRMARTLKGGARVCDLRGVEAIGHHMESLFAGVREGALHFDDHVAHTIDQALDNIEDWMAAFTAGGTPDDPQQTLAAIEALLNEVKSKPGAPQAAPPPAEPQPQPPSQSQPSPTDPAPASGGAKEIDSFRVQTQHLDTMLRSTDALLMTNSEQDHITQELTRLSRQMRDVQHACQLIQFGSSSALRQLSAIPEFAPVARHFESLTQQIQAIVREHRQLRIAQQRGAWTLRMVSDDLRRAAQQTRMISADNVFQGMRSLVRNLAKDQGKEIEFTTHGLQVQADRMVLQALKDPLMHVLRNAIVHGIESPDDRAAAGKDRTGNITLDVQTRGNRLHISVEDDGRGIDLKQLAQRASREGSAADETTDVDKLARMLFRPGFTTSKAVTELAGRGMGLSIVYETVTRLRGNVRIKPRRSAPGTILEITAPLLVSAERLLLVRSNEQTYAIPVHEIHQLAHLRVADVQNIEGRRMAIIDDVPMPLLHLAQSIGDAGAPTQVRNQSLAVVVVESDAQQIALVVDEFVAEREALIKTLDGPAAQVPSFSGAVVLDDNQVVLVVDPAAMSNQPVAAELHEVDSIDDEIVTPTILVVDDSFTTRTLEKSILETNGYTVHVAVDGIEALNVLRSESIQVVVADVQMPRMDGLELLQAIRRNPKLESLPLILVTSLDRAEDRKRGLDYGANAYIVKRKFDHQTLLDTIQRFI